MSDSEKKSVTIRLDEPDLIEWAAAQSSAVASIRMAVKICMLQYGKNVDLLDAILRAQFGNPNNNQNSYSPSPKTETIVRENTHKSHNTAALAQTFTEQNQSDNSQNIVTPTQQTRTQTNQATMQPVQEPVMQQAQQTTQQTYENYAQPMQQPMPPQQPQPQQNNMSSSLQSLL